MVPRDTMSPAEVELLETIRKDREQLSPYLVLADLLQASGDPRGELIAIQHALATTTQPRQARTLAATEKRLLVPTANTALLGGLRAAIRKLGPRADVQLAWRLGYLREVRVIVEDRGKEVERLLRELFTCHAGALLDSLYLQLTMDPAQRIMDVLATEAPSWLRELRILSREAALGSFAGVWQRLPHLTALKIGNWAGFDLGTLPLPELRALDLVGPRGPEIATILATPRPALERLHLDVYTGTPHEAIEPLLAGAIPSLRDLGLQLNNGAFDLERITLDGLTSLSLDMVTPRTVATIVAAGGKLRSLRLRLTTEVRTNHLAPIFEGALPELRDLYLEPIGTDHVRTLVRAPVLQQLESLVISDVSTDQLEQLVDRATAFRHLRRLTLMRPYDHRGHARLLSRLKKRLPNVVESTDSRLVAGQLPPG